MSSSPTRFVALSRCAGEWVVMGCGSSRDCTCVEVEGAEGAGDCTISRLAGIGAATVPGDFTGTAAEATERMDGSTGESAGSALGGETGEAAFHEELKGVVLLGSSAGVVRTMV